MNPRTFVNRYFYGAPRWAISETCFRFTCPVMTDQERDISTRFGLFTTAAYTYLLPDAEHSTMIFYFHWDITRRLRGGTPQRITQFGVNGVWPDNTYACDKVS